MATISSAGQENLAAVLLGVTESLDISDDLHDDAVTKYTDVGAWLATDDSELHEFSPTILPQGSFRLGTVVRPLSRNGAYDIDLVCQLELEKTSTTQEALKALVGRRLAEHEELSVILSPSRRCWTLDWSKLFHMDVLPSIPNREAPPTGILLTDTELTRWQRSNPVRYADWFKERMNVAFLEKRAALAKSLNESIEEVPEWRVRTPLQRVVQILKRHRDLAFVGRDSVRPVSIILTTLAAKAYRNQSDVVDALISIVEAMPSFIEEDAGKFRVMNPVEPGENFADKWNEDASRREAFQTWLRSVRQDVDVLVRSDLAKSLPLLERTLGREATGGALKLAESKLEKSTAGISSLAVSVPSLEQAPHALAPQWPVIRQFSASVQAVVYRGRSGPRIRELDDRPLPKNVSILFRATTDAPPPYDVFWQVVNTGPEARAARGLRGGFNPSTSDRVSRWEDTRYRGTHWVEAFVVKDGRCVARSGQRNVRIL